MREFTDVIDLGPELFASGDETVICWRGENYYRACGEFVEENPFGGHSTCVKRAGHPGKIHEDYAGQTRGEQSWARYFGWWNPTNEKEKWYTQGWNNGVITALVLYILVTAGVFLLAS